MSWIWGLYGTDFFQLMGLCNTHIAEMSCPFPKAGSDGESAECLIENTPRTKRGPPPPNSPYIPGPPHWNLGDDCI